MFKKTSAIFIAGLLILANVNMIVAQQSDAVALDRRVKAKVNDLGAGAKVTVFLKDGTKIQGNISQILDDSFDVTVKKETQSRIISYRDVQRIKKRGLTSGAKVGLGVAIGAAAIVTVLVVVLASSDGFLEGLTIGP
jgi:sRNA-binding regulator protein Hfq